MSREVEERKFTPPAPSRRRWVIISAWLALTCLIGVAAYYFGAASLKRGTRPALPLAGNSGLVRNGEAPSWVEIQHWNTTHGMPKYEVRDPRFLAVLGAMLPSDADAKVSQAQPPRPQYTVTLFHPSFKSGHPPKINVWQIGEQQYWSDDDRGTYKVRGTLELFLKALPARRLVEMLASQSESERAAGLAIKKLRGDELLDAALALAQSDDAETRAYAILDATALLRTRAPPRPCFMWWIERDRSRSAMAPRADVVRRTAMEMLRGELGQRKEAEYSRYNTIVALCDCLAETGDQKTANELAEFLGSDSESYAVDLVMTSLERLYGLPPTYEKGGMCGNSSDAEKARFGKKESVRRREARERLLSWHKARAADDRKTQLGAVLDQWQEHLLAIDSEPNSAYNYEPLPDRTFASLLGQGKELAPLLESRKLATTDDFERGALEFIRACLTSTCDRELVEKLIHGDARQQILACRIIAASGSRDWEKPLDGFQYTPLPKSSSATDFKNAETLRTAATAALLVCHGAEALPLIEKAAAEGPWNYQAQTALKFYSLPQAR